MEKFSELKQEILQKANEIDACAPCIDDLIDAETAAEMSVVLRKHFFLLCDNNVITAELIEQYRAELAAYNIHMNRSVTDGCVYVDGENIITAGGNSLVNARGHSLVFIHDSTKAHGHDECKLYAYNDSRCIARNYSIAHTYDNAAATVYDGGSIIR
jgi:hypothetical protein